VQQVFLLNKNSFFRIHLLPPFCIKTNFRENRFLGTRWAIGSEKAIPYVKICAENYTKWGGVRNLLLAKWGANLLGREQALPIGKTCRLEV
jgi:hypothetical protein